jgi:hypothetical protein
LAGKSPPLSDGQRGSDTAQRDFHGDVVTTDKQQHAQGGIVAGLVAQVVGDEFERRS